MSMAAGEYVSVHSQADAERTLATIRFGDHHPPHRIRSVCLRDQFHAQARQPCFQALLRGANNRPPTPPRSPCMAAGEPIGVDQDVTGSPGAVARPPAPAERGVRISRTTLFGSWFTAFTAICSSFVSLVR